MFPGRTKRQKEQSRNEHKKEKEARKEERKKEKEARGPLGEGVDPDIAHIVPGPQPKLEE